MDNFARRAAADDDDRLAFINEAAARRDVVPIIIEKDFWVCWTLRRLMETPGLGEHLTFKGGTSLSKAYGIIDRFSEDIDLTIGRSAPQIGQTKPPMENGISGKERDRRAKDLKAAAQAYVRDTAMPALEAAIEKAIGTHTGWALVLDPDDNDEQTILFEYPKLLDYGAFGTGGFGAGAFGGGYIKPRIKLEFGARGETEPSQNDVASALATFDSFWDNLFPAEQDRTARLLIERVVVSKEGMSLDLRTSGLSSLVSDMLQLPKLDKAA